MIRSAAECGDCTSGSEKPMLPAGRRKVGCRETCRACYEQAGKLARLAEAAPSLSTRPRRQRPLPVP